MNKEASRVQIGRYQASEVLSGTFGLDGGAMFGIVPRVVWQKAAPPDELNRIKLALRCLLLRGDGRTILVDTGIGEGKGGNEFDDRFAVLPAVEPGRSRLEIALAAHGIHPDEVTDCILTHLHWDHAGGATVLNPDTDPDAPAAERYLPQFRNATYRVQHEQFAWAENPTQRDRGSFRPEDWHALQGRLELLDGPGEILPGISVRLSGGHTPGLQVVEVDDGAGGGIVYPADLIPTAMHLRPAWVMGYDLFPATSVREKQELLEDASGRGLILFFEHDPEVAAARVRMEKGSRPAIRETFVL